MQLQYTLLYCLKQLNGERTVSSIYYLLKGKRSSQTLQDGNMFQISFLFGIYKALTRYDYNQEIACILNAEWIEIVHENTYVLTSAGEKQLNGWEKALSFPQHLHGLHYGALGEAFWKKLSLIIQTVSNLQQQNTRFIPIQQDTEVTMWVKEFLIGLPYVRSELATGLWEEMHRLLKEVDPVEATILTYRLTGYERIGYTLQQLAEITKQDVFRVHLLFWGTIHFFIQSVRKKEKEFPLLTKIISYPNERADLFSLSTRKTYQLWKQGRSLEEIATIRNLKPATIEDHFVEIALRERDFSIEMFVEKNKIEQVKKVIETLQTRKLRVLKQAVGEGISYFEVRLVLAQMEGTNET
ncbi:recombinase RecQ [Bacillus pseudomycoides]|uniref:Recombinase RecQ n=1 Tax=Bacillus pseudomycoides TaxID=64104 RepID=A0AA91VDQ4_9BACI|nr:MULTISPECIES: helix-turn-helix domain-containing protein [Bacillus]PEB52658.1 recombinase RecQ [Bacillus sp. AFS098217]PED83119.1 recombinase RecQ [Bacillus pseudomycoides]PEU13972.1 recombinase RecQ [Bacillus sp. AFS019443]PEU18808.1 recombinase RecQ [Bacillus sp. AFS014408]PFW63730.1 recombinase RecQ [Bacillus sp. AFS075034]